MTQHPAHTETLPEDPAVSSSFERHWQKTIGHRRVPELPFDETLTAQHWHDSAQAELDAAPDVTLSDLPRLAIAPMQDEEGAQKDQDTKENIDLRLRGHLGQGGMGRVDLAHQHSLRRDVAVKHIQTDKISPRTIGALLQEARLTGTLEHPNIIPVHALGVDTDGMPVMVMKRVEGVAWRALIKDPQHARWEQISEEPLVWHLSVLMQVCNAVHFAHTRGIIHRDIKPDNIMVGEFGEVYLLDWGIALEMGQAEVMERGALRGSPAYMAPEMVRGDPMLLSPRTDIYLLGACLLEVLTGQPPHEGDTLREVLNQAWDADLPPLPPDTDKKLAAICHRAMHPTPGQRFADAQSFRQALADHIQHRDSLRLSQAATAQLEQLRAAVDDPDAIASNAPRPLELFSACRFGFQQALKAWEENAEARAGYHEALELITRHEIGRGRLATAENFYKRLPVPPEDLERGMEALRAHKAHQKERLAQLQAQVHERDITVASGQRGRHALWTGAIWTSGILIVALLQYTGIYRMDHLGHVGSLLLCEIFLAVNIGLRRRWLLSTSINRQLMASSLFGVGSALSAGLLLWAMDTTVEIAIVMDFMVAFVCCLMMSLTVERTLIAVACPFLVAGLLGAAFPEAILLIAAGVTGLSHLLVYFVWSSVQRRAAASQPLPGLGSF